MEASPHKTSKSSDQDGKSGKATGSVSHFFCPTPTLCAWSHSGRPVTGCAVGNRFGWCVPPFVLATLCVRLLLWYPVLGSSVGFHSVLCAPALVHVTQRRCSFWSVLSLTWLSLVPALLLAALVSCSCPADGLGLKLSASPWHSDR